MNLKKLGTALAVFLALGAVMAGNAFATATEKTAPWIDSAGEITGTPAVKLEKTENGVLKTTVSETPLTLEATGVTCEGCTITNSAGKATASGKIKFTGVKAVTPPSCKVPGETVTTKALSATADWMEGTTALVKFLPKEGATFATVTLEECAIAGNYNVTGSAFAAAVNPTGKLEADQEIVLTPAINSNAGGALKFGAEAATLQGKAKGSTVSGTMEFGVKSV